MAAKDGTHNDGIQIIGGSSKIRILDNLVYDSRHQLVLIQDAIDGTNDDVLFQNNVVFGSGSWAVHNQGATKARYINNTIWGTKPGSLLLRRGKTGVRPTDTIVVNNILENFSTYENATARYRDYNFIKSTRERRSGNDMSGSDPGFVNVHTGDFHLRADAVARGRGSRTWSPGRDLEGYPRGATPSLGALEAPAGRSSATPGAATTTVAPGQAGAGAGTAIDPLLPALPLPAAKAPSLAIPQVATGTTGAVPLPSLPVSAIVARALR
jgi:hypothetical protein